MRFLNRRKSFALRKKDSPARSERRLSFLGGKRSKRDIFNRKGGDSLAENFKSGPLETPEGVKPNSMADLNAPKRFESERSLGPIQELSSTEEADTIVDDVVEVLVSVPDEVESDPLAAPTNTPHVANYFCACFDFDLK